MGHKAPNIYNLPFTDKWPSAGLQHSSVDLPVLLHLRSALGWRGWGSGLDTF